MVIYLRHPRHGTKVAVSNEEAVADEKNGWTRYQAGALLTPEEPAPENKAEFSEDEDLRARYVIKFGAPPHHRKTLDTIRRELEA